MKSSKLQLDVNRHLGKNKKREKRKDEFDEPMTGANNYCSIIARKIMGERGGG